MRMDGPETLRAFTLVLLFAAAAAAVWPLAGSVVPWDSKNHFYPMLRYLGAALEHGELPLWNPYHFSGHPSVADPQALLFTPTMLLFAWRGALAVDAALRRRRLRAFRARRARHPDAVPAPRLGARPAPSSRR